MDVAGSERCGMAEDVIHEADHWGGCRGGLQRSIVLRIGVAGGQVLDQRCQLTFVCRPDAFRYGRRCGHDGVYAAPATETKLLQRNLIQRVGYGQAKGSVGR
jgi:hypothetical protein